jgi:hypothetical protein
VLGCGNCKKGLGSGQALVHVAPVPDWATWSSGGPISHGTANVIGNKSMDIYPGAGLANDFEGEPGSAWTGRPYRFYENGVMTPLNGFGDAAVSSGSVVRRRDLTISVGPTVAAVVGAGFGAGLAPQHRATGALVGALAGGILGLLFG